MKKAITLLVLSLCSVSIIKAQCTSSFNSVTHVSCFGSNNGSLCVNGSGGFAPYTYQWSNGDTSHCISQLTAGNYTVTITDALSCTSSAGVTLNQPLPIIMTLSVSQPINCGMGNNGQLSIGITGGVPPFVYMWSNGSTQQGTLSNLTAGNYCVTVSDAIGCTASSCLMLTSPTALNFQVTSISNPCTGGTNGSVTAAGFGGTAPYQYNWSNGVTTAVNGNLPQGTYTVTVSDAAGCTTTDVVNLTESLNITPHPPIICPGDTISFNVTGAQDYTWSPATGLSCANCANPVASPSATTTYTIEGTGPSCTGPTISQVTVTVEPCASFLEKAGRVYYDLNRNGIREPSEPPAAGVTVREGSSPYYYFTSNDSGIYKAYYATGTYNLAAMGYPSGWLASPTYNILTGLTDTNNDFGLRCNTMATIISSTDASYICGSDGSAVAVGSGSTPPYTYLWSTGDTAAAITGLQPGIYMVTVSNAFSCWDTAKVTIQHPFLMITAYQPSQWAGDTVVLTAHGGANYLWSTGSTLSSIAVAPTVTTTYTVNVSNPANACTASTSIIVNVLGLAHQIPKAGIVYKDFNNNGIRDAGEPPVAQRIIREDPFPYYFATDDSGAYNAYYETGTYSLSLPMNGGFCASNPASHTLTGPSDTTNDFGYYCPDVTDVAIDVYQSAARPGFITYYYLYLSNSGTDTLDGSVLLCYDPVLTYSSSNVSLAYHANDSIRFNYQSLAPGQVKTARLDFQVPFNATSGDTLTSSFTIFPVANDTVPANNFRIFKRVITNAYDPNDKEVSITSLTPEELATEPELVYTVRFQNTGTDTAFTVVIRDSLSEHFFIPSLETVGSKHPCSFRIEPWGTAVWTFNNIMLPDSGTNYDASQGFVMFRIHAENTLNAGDTLRNTAAIYFDFNEAVITNTAKTAIVSIITGIAEAEQEHALQLFPNPTTGALNITFRSEKSSVLQLDLISLSGRLIYRETMLNFSGTLDKTLDLKDLPEGIYVVRLMTEHTTALKKMVLIR